MSKMNFSLMEMILVISFFVLVFTSESFAGEAELQQAKYRRGGSAGLFAFPRVGRNDPNLALLNVEVPASYEEYADIPLMEMKRGNEFVPFPRVGRSNIQFRKHAALQQQMGYGQRFGRLQKRNANDNL